MSGVSAATVAAYVAAAGAVVGVYSAIQSGEQQKDWQDYQAKQAQADAVAEKSAAEVNADKIRKAARIKAGEATASLAGSGVDVGEGTALNINKEIYGNAEEDAVMTVFGGKDRSARLNAEAQADQLKGSQAQSAGYLNATSTVLSAYGNYAKGGWKTPSTGSNGTVSGVGGR